MTTPAMKPPYVVVLEWSGQRLYVKQREDGFDFSPHLWQAATFTVFQNAVEVANDLRTQSATKLRGMFNVTVQSFEIESFCIVNRN